MTPPTAVRQHHQEMQRRFAQACNAFPEHVHHHGFLLCGRPVRVRRVGDASSAGYLSAFCHLPRIKDNDDGDLMIDIWDTVYTGVKRVPPETGDPLPEYGYSVHADDNVFSQHTSHTTSSYCRDIHRLVVSIDWGQTFPVRQRGKPLTRALAAWLNEFGGHFLHAGLVSIAGHGVLLAGSGGAGKSSTALACLDHGLTYLADDNVGLTRDGHGGFLGHSVYATALLERAQLARYPGLSHTAIAPEPPDDPKTALLFAPDLGDRLAASVPIRTVALCRVTGGCDTRVRSASKAETLLRLAPHSVVHLSNRPRSSFAALAALIEATPCFVLELGTNVAGIPAAVSSLVASRCS